MVKGGQFAENRLFFFNAELKKINRDGAYMREPGSGKTNSTALMKVSNFYILPQKQKWMRGEWKCTEFREEREGVKPKSDWGLRLTVYINKYTYCSHCPNSPAVT